MTVETNVSCKILVNQCLGKWAFRRHITYGKNINVDRRGSDWTK